MMRQESRLGFLDVSLNEVVVVSREQNEIHPRNTCPGMGCSSVRRQITWARNNASHLFFTLLYVVANLGLFLSTAYHYRYHNLLVMGARACGQCLNLDCVLLLTLILRRGVTKLRNSPLGKLLPCDSHVQFHKMAGWTVFFLSILHTIFHLANYAGLCDEQENSSWQYMWEFNLEVGWVAGLANLTGCILLLLLIIIVIFSHRCVRKSGYFELFYWTHLLSIPFWALMLLHGPCFWKWLILPGTAFLIELSLRLTQVCSSRGRSTVLAATALPSNVVKLVIKRPADFEFRAGEYVYLNIPAVARYEWHPLTISSAPEQEGVFTVHIRTAGGWTGKVCELFNQNLKNPAVKNESLNTLNDSYNMQKDGGLINPTFISPVLDEKLPTGNRYTSNLKEFNSRIRKMSTIIRPAILEVETESKFARHGSLERKKSSSLSSLRILYQELNNSGSSGWSSLIGSSSSIGSRSESEGSDEQDGETKQKIVFKRIEVYVDGPYGSPLSRIFTVSHAVLVGAGIGVTPFASILQSVMHRYRAAKHPCPHCSVSSCLSLPATLRKLRKVDFIWVNRDLAHFEWFLELLASLEEEQQVSGAAMERFLRLHLYKTGPEPIQPAMPLASLIHQGRPDWDKVLEGIRQARGGRVCVFYCGPPALATVVREKCIRHQLEFSREMF